MANLAALQRQLQQERSRLTAQLDCVNQALRALTGAAGSLRRRGKMSAAGIARIRAAQKARWAKWRKTHKRRH